MNKSFVSYSTKQYQRLGNNGGHMKKQGYNARKDEQLSGRYGKKKMSFAKRRKIAKATRKPKGTYGFKKQEKLMPRVGQKRFAYTKKGKAAAKKYAKKKNKKVK